MVEPNSESVELKKQGNEAYKARHFKEAERLYKEAYEADSTNVMALYNLSALYIEQQQLDDALSTISEAIAQRDAIQISFSDAAKLYQRRGKVLLLQKNYNEAIAMFKKSLTEVQDRAVRVMLREAERARDAAAETAYRNPELAEQHRQKGNEYFKQKDFPRAKVEYDEAIKRNPEDARLFSNRAACYSSLFEYPSAIADCDTCLKLDSSFVKAYSRKGFCYLKLKDYNKAKEAYEAGLAIDPQHAECRNGLVAVQRAIMEQMTEKVDESQLQQALSDPEIQKILANPQMQLVLKQMQENPQAIPQYLADPNIKASLEKLMACGVLRFGGKPE